MPGLSISSIVIGSPSGIGISDKPKPDISKREGDDFFDKILLIIPEKPFPPLNASKEAKLSGLLISSKLIPAVSDNQVLYSVFCANDFI